MLVAAAAVVVTAICVVSLAYSIRLAMSFNGGILGSVWFGVFFASVFLLICSIGTVFDVINGEEPLFEIGANLGIAFCLFFVGWQSQRFWGKVQTQQTTT